MTKGQSLSALLLQTFQQLNVLAEEDQHAEAYEGTRQRLAYLHTLVRQFSVELQAIRLLTVYVPQGSEDARVRSMFATLLSHLRSSEPRHMEAVGRALVTNSLELSELVGYFASSIAHIQHQRAIMATMLLTVLGAAPTTSEPTTESAESEPNGGNLMAYLSDLAQPYSKVSPEVVSQLESLLGEGLTQKTHASSGSNCEGRAY